MNTILLILCNALSCFIISTILFQFMNGKYKRSSQNRYAYIDVYKRQTCGIFGETGTDSEIDKWLERMKEDKEKEDKRCV